MFLIIEINKTEIREKSKLKQFEKRWRAVVIKLCFASFFFLFVLHVCCCFCSSKEETQVSRCRYSNNGERQNR